MKRTRPGEEQRHACTLCAQPSLVLRNEKNTRAFKFSKSCPASGESSLGDKRGEPNETVLLQNGAPCETCVGSIIGAGLPGW